MPTTAGTNIEILSSAAMRMISPDASKTFYMNVSNTGELFTSPLNYDPNYSPVPLNGGWIGTIPSAGSELYLNLVVAFDGQIGSSPAPTITASSGSSAPANISIVGGNTLEFDWDTSGTANPTTLIFTVASSNGLYTKKSYLSVSLSEPQAYGHNAYLWMDATDSATVNRTGNNVNSWTDKLRGMVMSTVGTPALYTLNTFNSKNSITFNGSNYLEGPFNAFTGSTSVATFIYVYKMLFNDLADYRALVAQYDPNNVGVNTFETYFGASRTVADDAVFFQHHNPATITTPAYKRNAVALTGANTASLYGISACVYDQNAGTNLKHKFIHRSYLNSSQNTLTAPSPTLESVSNGNQSIDFNSGQTMRIGYSTTSNLGAGNKWRGDIFEIIVLKPALTTPEILAVYTTLEAKYAFY